MDPIGKSPIPLPVLILGKAAIAGSLLFFLLKSNVAGGLLYDSGPTRTLGVLLALIGAMVLAVGLFSLGRSVSVGLPAERTELKTGGIYRFTRNPLYLGGFLAGAGSCLYALHPLNILLVAITVVIHHRIVIKEEEFLDERFGEQWRAYKERVPRYVGILKRTRIRE